VEISVKDWVFIHRVSLVVFEACIIGNMVFHGFHMHYYYYGYYV